MNIINNIIVKIKHVFYDVKQVDIKKYWIIIGADDIEKLDDPGFDGKNRHTQAEFVAFIEEFQHFLCPLETADCDIDKIKPDYNIVTNVGDYKLKHQYVEWKKFKRFFYSEEQKICVVKTIKGKYRCSRNGRHRLYIVKKYKDKGFRVPVCVVNIEEMVKK